MWLAGCGHYVCGTTFGSATCSSTSTNNGGSITGSVFVYFMDDKSEEMTAEGVNVQNSQSFATIPNWTSPPTLSTGTINGGIAIVDQAYLYMPESDGNVYEYSINSTTAALTAIAGNPVNLALPSGVASPIVADPAGKYVFVGTASGIYVLSVTSGTGALASTNGGLPYGSTGLQPIFMTTDGLGKYLYVLDGSFITAYSYSSSTGTLTSLETVASEGMMMLAGEPTGNYLFGSTELDGSGGGAVDNNFYMFAITPSTGTTPGSLASMTTISTPETPSYVAVSPNLENGNDLVYTFNFDASTGGAGLEPIIEAPFNPSTGTFGTALVQTDFLSNLGMFDPSGNFLIIQGSSTTQTAAGILALSVSSTGALTTTLPNAGNPLNVGHMAVTDGK